MAFMVLINEVMRKEILSRAAINSFFQLNPEYPDFTYSK